MPKYDYQCPGCGWTGEVGTHYDQRDNVRCPECNALMSRLPHYHSTQTMIPCRFREAMLSDYPTSPRNAEERATWEKDGVAH